jgi:acid phosphatase
MHQEINLYIFGDAGLNTETKNKVATIVNKNKESRIILLGDNFYKNGIDSENDERWKTDYENIFPGKKIYAILGNHCYIGNIAAQINYSKINCNWVMPKRYYDKKIYFDEKTYVHLIGLDTFEIAQDDSIKLSLESGMNIKRLKTYMKNFDKKKQLEWLNETLKKSTAKWKIVFGHYPIFSNGISHGNCKEMIEDVLPILVNRGANVYFSGHDHNICYSKYKNLHCLVSGNGCYTGTTKTDPFFFNLYSNSGVSYVSCKKESFEFGFCDLTGKKIFSQTLI